MILFESIELEYWNEQSLILNDCILIKHFDLGFANINNCPINEAEIMRTCLSMWPPQYVAHKKFDFLIDFSSNLTSIS